MPFAWVAAGSALVGAYASTSAASQQADAANHAADLQNQQYLQSREDMAPWREHGAAALTNLSSQMGPGGYFTHQFDAGDLKSNLAPNYDWMLSQGQQANLNASNVTGGLAGNALKGLQDYTQNYAMNAYQQAYQNYTANQTNIYNRLSNLAGLGQTANQATSSAGMNAALNAGNFSTSGAAASAAGRIGVANSINNGLDQYMAWKYANQKPSGDLTYKNTPPNSGPQLPSEG